MQNKDSVLNNLSLFFVTLFAVLLPFDMLYSTIAVYPVILLALVALCRKKFNSPPRQFWIFSGVFLLSISGYLYSTDTWRAGYLLERQLLLFIFPLLLPLGLNITGKNIRFILYCFAASSIYSILYLLFFCFEFLYLAELPIRFLLHPRFYNHQFSEPIGVHAGYLSLYLSLSLLFLLSELNSIKRKYWIVVLLGMLILCVGLYFLASRTTIISTGFVLIFIYPLFRKRNKWIAFAVNIALLAIMLIIASKSEYIHDRFSSGLRSDLTIESNKYGIEAEPRIRRWECAFFLINKKPVFGYGTGDEIPLLKEQYLKHKMMISYSEEFDSHNQYIAYLLKHGIVGLVAFLCMMIYFFVLAIRGKDFLYLAFLTILSISLFAEDILDTNKGIFYFALFNTLFGYRILFARKIEKEELAGLKIIGEEQ